MDCLSFFLKDNITYTAGIPALLPGAEHVVHDTARGRVSVGVLALGVVPDLHRHLLQGE